MIVALARLKVKEGMANAFIEVAQELVTASRAEPGCLGYELLQEGPLQFSFLERYADAGAVEAHRKTEHFRTHGRKLGEFMEGRPDVIRLTAVDENGHS